MFGIGMSEMLVICGVALLVFGPNELPKIAKKIARGVQELRRASDDLRRSIDLEGDDDDDRPKRAMTAPPSITGSALNAPDTVTRDEFGHPIAADANAASDGADGVPRVIGAGAVAVGADLSDPPAADGTGESRSG